MAKNDDPPVPDLDGSVTFGQFFRAPWEAGDYRLSVTQSVANTGATDPSKNFSDSFSAEMTFEVQGPRFSLAPDRMHVRYPPAGGNGEYSNVLPHVVFTIDTLPWQRDSMSPTEDVNGDDATDFPWLALLVFDDADAVVPIPVAGDISKLLAANLPEGTLSYPELAPEIGEEWKSGDGTIHYAPCTYIDVPGDLFSAIAPAKDDLRWLAHARGYSAGSDTGKPLVGGTAPPQRLSVIVANRLPRPGTRATCFLVSIESMNEYLPPVVLSASTTLRLAVLSTWSFGVLPSRETFADYFEQLDKSPATLQLAPATGAQPETVAALAMGYAGFGHQTRQGAQTVSWYRGPLLPYSNSATFVPPWRSADDLLRYDPASGMFDATYAAAWQLGQLLALHDKSFASALYDWKLGQKLAAAAALEQEALEQRLAQPRGALGADGDPLHVALMKALIKPALQSAIGRTRENDA